MTLVAEGRRRTPSTRRLGAVHAEGDRDLTWLIATINAWNRLAIGFRAVPPVKETPATAQQAA